MDTAEAGFRAYAVTGPLPDPEALAQQAIRNSYPWSNYVALAGADLLFQAFGRLVGTLDAERCTALLCLGLVHRTQTTVDGVTRADERPWLRHVAAALPDESGRAVRGLLMPQIGQRRDLVGGLREVCEAEGFEAIRRSLVPELLAAVHAPGSAFDALRHTAIKESDPAVLGVVVRARLRDAASAPHRERWPWLLLAWRLAPGEHEQALADEALGDDDLLSALMQETGDDREGFGGGIPLPLTVRHRATIVRVTGPRFPPVPAPDGSWSPPTPYDRARFVHRHIAAIGDTAGPEAEAALRSLFAEPGLADHSDHILHTLSAWQRNARLERREVPPLPRLVRSLAGGTPATAAELHAFAVAHLEGLRDALRTTGDNAWRAFWNVEAKAGPTNARPENDCRDAVVRFLDARFQRAGLAQDAEARFVGDTRCDIAVRGIDAVVPVEVKCDWHPRLWTAWRDQLQAQYACDPCAAGFGILTFPPEPDPPAVRELASLEGGADAEEASHGGADHRPAAAG